ncbi:hypothetical protein M501DRAFT_1011901 [Patellaria atrata CBS 101060]|uniref:Basic proline-rich protein n=1 Tax=Patellaria atrata CBS 101060 TaxID=1346257 RepID=A0A9P4S9H3_9PEZI|nr:hypothetical protein M501DRAFT_1011901 [Patellaria atrata CBS 101060]
MLPRQQLLQSPRLLATLDEQISDDLSHSQIEQHEGSHVERVLHEPNPRPVTPRAATDPSILLHPHNPLSSQPRNRSPYSRSHLRSHSSSGPLSAPPMARARSLPSVNTSGQLSPLPRLRSSSPLRSPGRPRSPLRSSLDELYPLPMTPTLSGFDIESISEDSVLDITPRPASERSYTGPLQVLSMSHSNSLPRTRRRPASPLHQVTSMPFGSNGPSTPTSATSSPSLLATKFNEAFPMSHYPSSFSSSSVPSTPTSIRSRSPSISSLETIPDSPDAEEAAIEEDNMARLKAAAEAAENGDNFKVEPPRGRSFGFGNRDKRKRWSVCGAERRGDLNLDTIWEDGKDA